MLNSENKRVGYTEVYYNYNADKFFTEDFGNQFKELPVSFSGGGGGLQSGDNISLLTNDVGYLTSYSFPSVTSLPTTDLSLGKIVALSTDNRPYFYDGTNWRRIFLADAPPASGDPDTDWDKVLIRCTYNTDFTDVKNNKAAFTDADIVGSPSKFGGGSMRIQGSELCSYSYQADEIDQDWMNSAFTIEAWFYFDSLSDGDTTLYSKDGLQFIIRKPDALNEYFMLQLPGQAAVSIQNNPDFSLQEWMHIAYCRNGESGLLTLYVNGIKYNSIDAMNNFNDGTNGFTIGGSIGASADFFIDDLRVSNFERYTATYTPPTEELPTSG